MNLCVGERNQISKTEYIEWFYNDVTLAWLVHVWSMSFHFFCSIRQIFACRSKFKQNRKKCGVEISINILQACIFKLSSNLVSNIWRNYFVLDCIQVRICLTIVYFNYKNKLLYHIGSDNYWIIFFLLSLYYIIILVWHGHYLIQAHMWVHAISFAFIQLINILIFWFATLGFI